MTDQQKGKTLVLGAGAGGIQAALDLAQAGYEVILAEASDHTGGLLSKLDQQFPTSSCGFCRMLPMADRDKGTQHCLRRGFSHENIDLRLGTTLADLEGEPGAFTASFEQTLPLVDPDKCMGCGICEQLCPVEIPDPFNEGLTKKKAVGRPNPQSFPNAYTIDSKACTRCGECETACPTGAIILHPTSRAAFKILVVDDESIVRDSMKEWLSLEGYGVDTADSGAKALEMMEQTAYAVLLTDIKMPGMDGVELLEKAKEVLPDITVIMMTAYAEVDSAVSAMKQGALDYVTKPFEPEKVVGLVNKIYDEYKADTAVKEAVDAVILATGTGFYLPEQGKNIFGYGRFPNVVTALEFERRLSPAGPKDMAGVKRVAWIQCVGSRTREQGFCSSVCCMISIKQSLLAKEQLPDLERAAVFYMDLRTPGKDFDDYRTQAKAAGVDFVRSRIHSIGRFEDPKKVGTGEEKVVLRYATHESGIKEEAFDIVVLAVGQSVTPETKALIESLELETDAYGFVKPAEFAPHETSRPGIFTSGGLTGFKDIETTVTLGAAAAMAAAQTMSGAGKLSNKQAELATTAKTGGKPVATEAPKIHILACACSRYLGNTIDTDALTRALKNDPGVGAVDVVDDLCSQEGWEKGLDRLRGVDTNRLVLAGCPGITGKTTLAEAARALQIPAHLTRSVDMLGLAGKLCAKKEDLSQLNGRFSPVLMRAMGRAVAELKGADPVPSRPGSSFDRALVVGGGAAGMTAALAIAASGFEVDLVEKGETLGGNLSWIRHGLEGEDTQGLCTRLRDAVAANNKITAHLSSRVAATNGLPGKWMTTLETGAAGEDKQTCRVPHGVVVMATGGREADARDTGPGIYTQKAFQTGLDEGAIEPASLSSLVMIQCRDCREKDRNYCSRVCCPRAVSQAIFLKEKNPDIQIYVLYRDMMTIGNLEGLYTRAREAGVIFIPYEAGKAPKVIQAGDAGSDDCCRVACHDPVLGMDMEIEADAVVMAVGVVPVLPPRLAGMFTASLDEFGFFKTADSKWRPVDALHPRVLGCGLALKPCDLSLARATALATGIRAVGILSGIKQGAAAHVKTAYCSLCLACISACPFNARILDTDSGTIVVDAQACQGCGICEAICPSKAARVEGAGLSLDVIDNVLAI